MRAAPGASTVSPSIRTYALVALAVVGFLHQLDKVFIYMFLEPIKKEFLLTDTEVGIISGAAFAITYGLIGVPVARLSDRGNRKWIIGACLATWSLFTAICGASTGFISLLLARIGVGAGEAGAIPATHSLLGDYYPRDLRSRALAVVTGSMALGAFFGMMLGGIMAQTIGWRNSFYVMGSIGILLAVIFQLTVREPDRPIETEHPERSMKGILRELGDIKSFIMMALAQAFAAFTGAAMAWLPSYFQRSFSLSPLQVGLGLGLSIGLPFAIGTFLGGHFSMRHVGSSKSWSIKFAAITIASGLPFYIGSFLAPNAVTAFMLLFASMLAFSAATGPIGVAVQDLISPRARATAVALIGVLSGVVGAGLGPVLIGAFSDLVGALDPSANSLRFGLIAVSFPLLLTCSLYWMLARRIDASYSDSHVIHAVQT